MAGSLIFCPVASPSSYSTKSYPSLGLFIVTDVACLCFPLLEPHPSSIDLRPRAHFQYNRLPHGLATRSLRLPLGPDFRFCGLLVHKQSAPLLTAACFRQVSRLYRSFSHSQPSCQETIRHPSTMKATLSFLALVGAVSADGYTPIYTPPVYSHQVRSNFNGLPSMIEYLLTMFCF